MLLVDENLPPRLAVRIQDIFPGSVSVQRLGMLGANDPEIWNSADELGLSILTRDGDFVSMALRMPQVVKVIRIQVSNPTLDFLEEFMRKSEHEIATFLEDADARLLLLPEGLTLCKSTSGDSD